MEITQEILLLLNKKLNLFLEFENYTHLLTTCNPDAIANYITKRTNIANKIDNVTEQICDLIKDAAISPPAADILANRCAYSAVAPSWQPIFTQAQEIKGVASRCLEINTQVTHRLTELRAYYKKRIIETKNTPRLIKYLNSSGTIPKERSISIRNKRI